MVKHFDFQQLTRPNQIARHLYIRLARRRVAGRVVVHEHDGCRAANHRNSEHLARMHQHRVHRADGHKLMPFHPAARVQQDDSQTFAFQVEIRMRRNVQPPIVGGLVRRLANEHGFRHRTFPQGNDLEFLRIEVSHGRPRFPQTSGQG